MHLQVCEVFFNPYLSTRSCMQRLVDTQNELRLLYKLAQTFQEGSQGCYIYGQDCAEFSQTQEALEGSNGHQLTMR